MGYEKAGLTKIEGQIVEWLKTQSGTANEDLIAELLLYVFKLTRDEASRGDLKILVRAFKEMRHAFRVFAPYRSVRKVSIFGSTRVEESDPCYTMARDLGRRLAQDGFMIITGAGSGIMQAGNEGAGRDKSFGVNIRLPSIQLANRYIKDDPKLINFHFFFTRKLMFVKEADAVVIFPGGYGTHDELTEAMTLAQTGKSQLVPIILLEAPGGSYWQRWQEFVREGMLSRGYISPDELVFFKVFNDVESAAREIKHFYRNYHSYRFVDGNLVIRLTRPPVPRLIDTINREFSDILTGEPVRQTEPLPDESDDPDTLHLHRLLVHFNRVDFARLRQMIDVINREE